MARHYAEVHGYDRERAEQETAAAAAAEDDGAAAAAASVDPEEPDGALCPACGEHFANRHLQIRHLLRQHTRSGGEQCLYCRHRYLKLEEHIEERHQAEKVAPEQFCKKCLPEQKFSSFADLLRHTRAFHRKQQQQQQPSKSTDADASKKKAGEYILALLSTVMDNEY